MSKVDPIFIIGVIREKEKNFLQPDEYVRLMEDIHALRDTPYGETLGTDISLSGADAAIEHHLRQELVWLRQYLDNEKVLAFITARYDAINIVSALMQFKQGSSTLELPSSLGSMAQDALFAAIWDLNMTLLGKSPWKQVVAEEIQAVQKADWHPAQLLGRMSAHRANVLRALAFTPLTRHIARIDLHRAAADAAVRLDSRHTVREMAAQLKAWGYTYLAEDILTPVKNHISATAYELAWDREIVAAIAPYRFHVSGYDPVIAYWLAKQIESQNVRLIIAGRLAGLPTETIASFARPYYQPKSV